MHLCGWDRQGLLDGARLADLGGQPVDGNLLSSQRYFISSLLWDSRLPQPY